MTVSHETVSILLGIAGLEEIEEDVDLLQALLENQIAAAQLLLSIDTRDLHPILEFDPRWH